MKLLKHFLIGVVGGGITTAGLLGIGLLVMAQPNLPVAAQSAKTAVLSSSDIKTPKVNETTNPGIATVKVTPSTTGTVAPTPNTVKNDVPPPSPCTQQDACGAKPILELSGIKGTIKIGPTPSVCRVDTPCDQPYQATVIVKNEEGKEVTRFTSDENGHFQIDLPPGTYTLEPVYTGRYPSAQSQTVKVESEHYTEVEIQYDSGRR